MASTSIFQSLQGQTYNRVADQVVEAGIAYATACLKKNGTIYWTSNLTPKTTCTGSISSGTEYVEQNDTYSSTFTVAPPSSSGSQAPSAVVTGTVTLANGKQYVAKGTVIVELASTASMVTALPSSPTDGMEVYYVANSANRTIWHLRYNSSSPSAYKWEFLGGSPLAVTGTGGGVMEPSIMHNHTTGMVIPRTGEYILNGIVRIEQVRRGFSGSASQSTEVLAMCNSSGTQQVYFQIDSLTGIPAGSSYMYIQRTLFGEAHNAVVAAGTYYLCSYTPDDVWRIKQVPISMKATPVRIQ